MRKIIVAVAAVVGGLIAWQVIKPASEVTTTQMEAAIVNSVEAGAQRDLYATLSEVFPQEYQAFLQQMTDFANEEGGADAASRRRAFSLAQQFTANLRIANAGYIANAPIEDITRIRVANVAILEDLLDTPAICARYALQGGASISLDQLEFLDLDLIAASGDATFRALAAGRDTPVTHGEVTDADLETILAMWAALPDVTPALEATLMSGDMQDPDLCAANISFEAFLAQSSDPTVQDVSVYLSLIASGI